MGVVYKLANASPSLPSLTTNIIRALFVNLKDDSLVFLIGIVMQSLGINENRGHCTTALRHAAAFLKAKPNMDFQVILPSLVVAMQDADSGIREAALECVEVMAANNKEIQGVYAFDVIYGESSSMLYLMFCHGPSNVKSSPVASLQYLDVVDWSKYLQAIVGYKDHIAKDAEYCRILHQQHLTRAQGDSKAEIKLVISSFTVATE